MLLNYSKDLALFQLDSNISTASDLTLAFVLVLSKVFPTVNHYIFIQNLLDLDICFT